MNNNVSFEHVLRRGVVACGTVPAGIGLVVLVGWAMGWGGLTGGRSSYIPMAPNSALLFALLGGAMVATVIGPAHRWVCWGLVYISLYTVMMAGITLGGFLTGVDLGIDHWLFHSTGRLNAMRIGHMSPLTALGFLLIGIAFLARDKQSKSVQAILGSMVTLIGWVIVMGYAYGAPLLYGGTVIPVALPTAVGLTSLGVALIGEAGTRVWPLRCVSGPGTQARLMRGLLPAVFLLLLVKDWIFAFVLKPSSPSLVLASAIGNIVALGIVGLLISRLSMVLGLEIDHTMEALRASEERFRQAVVDSPFPIMLHSENGDVHQVSQSWCEITGYSPEELRTTQDWAERAYGERSRLVRAEIDQLYALGHRVAEGDYPIRTKSGGTRIWEFSSAPLGRLPGGQRLVISMATDVTERRQAEASLRETRDYLQNLLDYANAPIIVWDPQFRITRFNHAFESLTGRKAGDVVGQSLEILFPAAQVESSMAHIRNALAGERWETVEISIRHLDGSVHIVLWNSATLYAPDGKTPVATIAQGQEITERKRAEQALTSALSLTEATLESTDNGILVVSNQGAVVRANGRFVEMWRIPGQILTSGEDERLLNHILDQLCDPDAFVAKVKCLYGEAETESFDTIRFKDGRIFERLSKPMLVAGKSGGRVWSFRDITARKRTEEALTQSESLYRSLVDNIPQCILRKDREGRFTFADKSFCRLVDKPLEQVLGKTDLDFYPASLAEKYRNNDVQVQETRKVFETEEEHVLPSGEVRQVHVIKVPIIGSSEEVVGIQCLFEDITARKRTEARKAELEAQNRQLQKAESLGRMAGAIAHHFNNQLQAVMMSLELAKDSLRQKAGPLDALTQAMQSARKAAAVSGLMLTYLGHTPGHRKPIDLAEVCRSSASLLRAATPQNLVLDADLPSPGPAISADPEQIAQVLTQLVTNACEASGDRRGCIRLSVQTASAEAISAAHRFPVGWQPRDPVYACLEVTDTGSGIAEQDMESIFDPFFSNKFTGRGMGLAVVLGIVRAHDGAVTVASNLGRGSVFQIYFPVSEKAVPCPSDPAAQAPKFKPGGTVLLVEDEPILRHVTASALKGLGFTVLAAKDGVEAVEMFRHHQDRIRFVLCDLTMPRLNGWETLVSLRQMAPEIPVILSSGYSKAQAMGGDHAEQPQAFLAKPFEFEQLSRVIGDILAGIPGNPSAPSVGGSEAGVKSVSPFTGTPRTPPNPSILHDID